MGNEEATVRFFALLIAGIVAGGVSFDAQKRGFKMSAVIGWSVGVFLAMIVFLPAYLWVRRNYSPATIASNPGTVAPIADSPIAGVPCPYCSYPNPGNPDYCAKCGRQLKSSTEIHR